MSNAIHIALGGDGNVASDGIAILFTLFQDYKAIIGMYQTPSMVE